MKDQTEDVRGWLRKAHSDEIVMGASLKAGAYDAACFHAQQAAEKYLKAFLIYAGVDFPYTHNLVKLVELCADVDPSFRTLVHVVEPLTPYAVEMRYDAEFWPDEKTARDALQKAYVVGLAVRTHLPAEIIPERSDEWRR